MPNGIRLTSKAEIDVEGILLWFLAVRAEAAGRRWLEAVNKSIATLETMPERCALAPEAEDLHIEIRELLLGNR